MLPLSKRLALLLVVSLAIPPSLYAADYTYQQTTQLTGGSLLHMMKSVGFISSQARHMGDPVVSTIYLKDNRLANVSAESIEIIDLDKETITHVDVQKKTYTVMTFDQMKQAMANARATDGEAAGRATGRAARSRPEGAGREDELRREGAQDRRSEGDQRTSEQRGHPHHDDDGNRYEEPSNPATWPSPTICGWCRKSPATTRCATSTSAWL